MTTSRMSLGEILLKMRILDEAGLQTAQRKANQEGMDLADAIVRLNLASEEQVATARSKEFGIPFASRTNQILKPEKDQGLENIIDERFARENVVVPLFSENGTLAVAVADPNNVMVLENIKLMSNLDIQPFLSTKAEILGVIDSFYGGDGDVLARAVDTESDEDSADMDVDLADTDGRLNLDKPATGKGAHVVNLVNAVMKQAIADKCSDIHLESFDDRTSLRFRIDGQLYDRPAPRKEDFHGIISRIKILSKLDIAERRLPQDGTFSITLQNRTIEVRVSTLPAVFGEKCVMRLMDRGKTELRVDGLGFEGRQKEDFLQAANCPHGLIFLTGPTGSGKTTTLYSVINTIKTPKKNFMTVEDPVEIKMDGVSQCQVKPNIGLTYAAAIKSFLRQDPDVILVGEVRDGETAMTCLRAAMTGHLVLSTLHTNDAMSAVARLIDLGIENYLLANSLLCVAAQRLVRVLCPTCRAPYKPEPAVLEQFVREGMITGIDPQKVQFYKAVGCEKCAKTGYIGRRAVYEVYRITEPMMEIISKDADTSRLKEAARKSGMLNMRGCAWRKVMQGLTTVEEILSVTMV